MNELEVKIVKYLQRIGKGKVDPLTNLVSSVPVLAVFWTCLGLCLAWYFPEKRNIFVAQIIIVTILHFSISEGFFKYILPRFIEIRKRPYIEYPKIIKPIGYRFSDSSIPSSHMTSTIAMLYVISNTFPVFIVPSIALALFMSFARIHNGMHYPSDILLGIILGLAYAIISIQII